MADNLGVKLRALRKKIREMDSALVAFSGGVDSSLLLRICREELGEKAVAVTMLSEDYPSADLAVARRVAKVIGVKHLTVRHGEPGRSRLSRYRKLARVAKGMGLKSVANGSHSDDAGEHSRNMEAARVAGVCMPLLECSLSKAEIRLLAKELGLPNWDREQSGRKIPPASARPRPGGMGAMKDYLRSLNISPSALSVRAGVVRITLDGGNLKKLSKDYGKVRRKASSLGFSEVVLKMKE